MAKMERGFILTMGKVFYNPRTFRTAKIGNDRWF